MEVQITKNPEVKNFVSKSHYKFAEVLEKFELKPYILRFWESEFDQITPITSDAGQKIYTPRDLYFISRVKNLLLEQKLPIQKAKLIIDKEALGNFTKEEKTNQTETSETPPNPPQKQVEVSRFRKSLYSKSRAQIELNQVKDTLKKAQERINQIKNDKNWI